MMKAMFALGLLAASGTALAYQQQPAETEEAVEVSTQEADGAEAATADTAAAAPVDEAPAEAAADGVDLEEEYQTARMSYNRCIQSFSKGSSMAAAASGCSSQRKRMSTAKKALKASK
ncbi:MAG TPA: hypothetical protein VGB48_04085 [Allosphingosinicella sp.]|jgi:hypothetical protein